MMGGMFRRIKIKNKLSRILQNGTPQKEGFTLIEILMVVAVTGMLASLAVPNFLQGADRRQYEGQVQMVFDLWQQARAEALAFKKCPDGTTAQSWDLVVEYKLSGSEIRLECLSSSGTEVLERIDYSQNRLKTNLRGFWLEDYPLSATNLGNLLDGENFLLSEADILRVRYEAGRARAVLVLENASGSRLYDLVKLAFEYQGPYFEPGEKKSTICLNRVSGFPLLSLGNDLCSPLMP